MIVPNLVDFDGPGGELNSPSRRSRSTSRSPRYPESTQHFHEMTVVRAK